MNRERSNRRLQRTAASGLAAAEAHSFGDMR